MLDYKDIWDSCLITIRKQIPEKNFNVWFKPIIPQKYINNTLTIQVPSHFFYEWLEKNYVEVLKNAIKAELGENGKLEYSIIMDKGHTPNSPHTINLPSQEQKKTKSKFNPLEKAEIELNTNYRFETFIEGDCNQLVKSAAQAVAKKIGKTSFNPLMVYGDVGLGKTHIVQAIGNYIKEQYPEKNVVYTPTEKFTTQFIDSIRNNEARQFAEYYVNSDILILDDVQFLVGKEKTQEVFFHIFNHLYQVKKQIVITSDCAPGELRGLQDRLLSRFKWGLTADLQQPDFETRVAIIKNKIKEDGIVIPEHIIEYIASSITTNIREMEGVIISILAQASLNKKDINLELVKQIVSNVVKKIDVEISLDYIKKTIAKQYEITLGDLHSKSRKQNIVQARQLAMYLAKLHTNYSLKFIGLHFGGRNHSTVVHAINTIEQKLSLDQNFNREFESMRNFIQVSLK
jgi:chromosomal replication initiator protein